MWTWEHLYLCVRDLMMGCLHKQLILVLVVSAALPARNYQHSALLSRNYTVIPLLSRLGSAIHEEVLRGSLLLQYNVLLLNQDLDHSFLKQFSSDPFVLFWGTVGALLIHSNIDYNVVLPIVKVVCHCWVRDEYESALAVCWWKWWKCLFSSKSV